MLKIFSRKIRLLVLINFLVVNLNFVYSQCATFDQIGPLCTGTIAPSLPLVSNEGIAGVWSPSSIDMSIAGTQTYIFLSSDPSCTDFITMDITVNQTPSVLINGLSSFTTNLCIGSTLTMNATSSDVPGPNSYLWQSGASVTAGTILNYSPSSVPTPNPILYTLFGFETGNSCVGQATATITVNTLPIASFTSSIPGSPITICDGGSVNFTAAGVGNTYQWLLGGAPIVGQTSQTYSATTAGVYSVVVTNSNGCSRTSSTRSVVVNPLPTASISYAGSPFCSSGAITVAQTGTTGGTYTALPAGLSINAGTGAINLAGSLVGTYTVTYSFSGGGCSNTATSTLTINPPPSATISYLGSPFCATGIQTVTQTGTAGGTYSSGLGLTIDGTAGTIDLAASTPGSYTVTYEIAASGSCSAFTTTASVTINALPSAIISYTGSPYCPEGNATVLRTGTAGGTYSSTAGLIINAGTGAINLATSTPGTYAVTYSFNSAGCSNTATTSVIINPLPTATISYAGSPFCATGNTNVTQTGPAGGTYTSTVGLTIDAATGLIDLTTSAIGTYLVTYSFAIGGCANSTTTSISVIATPTATISYVGSPFCSQGTATVIQTGTVGGTYSSSTGIAIDGTTGVIDLASSIPGSYTIIYTIAASGNCPLFDATFDIVIDGTLPVASISYDGSPFCATGIGSVTQTGVVGGTYSSSAGLTIDAVTGDIDLETSTAGTYLVTYSFTNGSCSNTTTTTVTINASPAAVVIAGGPLTFCDGNSVTLSANVAVGLTYQWQDAGVDIPGETSSTYIATFSGSYTVIVTNSLGCSLTSAVSVVSVTQNVAPIFTPVGPICSGGALSLPAISNDGVLGSWSPAFNNTSTTTYSFTPLLAGCASAVQMTVIVNSITTPSFDPVAPICSGEVLTPLPTADLNGITGVWSPILNNTSTTTYTYTPDAGQCASTTTLIVTVNPSVTPTFNSVAPICEGEVLTLPSISNEGIIGTWTPSINNLATTTYTFSADLGQCAASSTMTVAVNSPITPTFDPIDPVCLGTLLTLPITSTNGITGAWAPTFNSSSSSAYLFTPTLGACATTAFISVDIISNVTSTFTQVEAVCSGGLFILPTTSNEGISGTWSPPINNVATTTYTFTPDLGQCGTSSSMTVEVNPPIAPTFTAVNPICSGDLLSPLPLVSINLISGTWLPALNNTATTTYTFTPDAGQCGSTTTMVITVNSILSPTFNSVDPICAGAALSPLPTVSNNGIFGSWFPPIDNTTTTLYTFTPEAGECASTATLSVTVNPNLVPTFDPVDPVCSGTVVTLPTTSTNGISGTWAPSFNSSSSSAYTFTPTFGVCATTSFIAVDIISNITSTFTQVSPVCSGDLFTLPTSSNEGIIGTWSPPINNLATTTYTFTPDLGQCGTISSMTVEVNAPIIPTFTAVNPICAGASLSALPAISNNFIAGTWLPSLNNTATTTYTFTPNIGQCANDATLIITVNPIVTPTFVFATSICSGETAPILPSPSAEGITGTWSPSVVNNTASGSYLFTPSVGQCAVATPIAITINTNVTPTFAAVSPLCAGSTFSLPTSSTNSIIGTWSPAFNNTTSTTYTFTPSLGQCAVGGTTLSVAITTNVTPTFTQVAAICLGGTLSPLPTTDLNGITGVWSPALDNATTTTYTFTPTAGQCATTTTMTITVNPTVTPSFTAVAAICSGSTLSPLPTADLNGITGVWSPALNNTSTTTYSFTPAAGQCASTTTMTITVNPSVTPLFATVAPICEGDAFSLPPVSTDGVFGFWSPAFDNTATTTYTFTGLLPGCLTPTTMTVVVNQIVTPTFTSVGPICSGETLSALPNTDVNGISGIWSPAINNTATTAYTFVPSAGQCATNSSMTIVVSPNITPSFAPVGPICSGSTLNPLPTIDLNGITGSWSPALDNTATTTYTFTPTSGQCALTTTLTITVSPNVTPTFTPIGSICFGATLNLPTVDLTGITGSWSPAPNNTSSSAYLFTPDAGQCATNTFMAINVNPIVTPSFSAVAPLCAGSTFSLPTTSVNGITGTWSPAFNSAVTTTYTFTPDVGQCAISTTLTITITPNVTTTFAAVGPFCSGATISPLATTSNEGISGDWSPALNNTSTTIYTFTPTTGICALTQSMTIVITPNITPTFTTVSSFCAGATITPLQTPSNEGITGAWSPALDNTSTTTYTFTPTTGVCALSTTTVIIINPIVTPTFGVISPVCQGASFTLPTLSVEGITGTWSPAFNNVATTTYTFTPDANQCAVSTTLTVTITPNVTPVFTAVGPFCSGSVISALQTVDNNGITGSWSPPINNTATTTYTFTPSAGVCAWTQSMTVVITPNATPVFTAVSPICSGGTLSPLPTTDNNGITGSWSPALNNTTTTTYTFTPTAGVCALTQSMTITVNPIVTPTFAAVSPYCIGATVSPLPTTSTNGITGSWSPALDNTTTTTYTFSPNAGQCAITTTMTIVINQLTVPTFDAVSPACEGSALTALPTVSLESIAGSWSPVLDNMNTTTYTFTPTAGQCSDLTTLTITINPPTVPTFTQVGPICVGNTYTLLASSLEAVTGAWSPAIDNTQTTTYTFTPDAGQCSATTTMTVSVVSASDADFTVSNYCDGVGAAPVVTGLTGGVFSFNPLVNDGATIDPITGLISNGVINTTYIVQYTLTGLCTVFSQELVSFVITPTIPIVSNDTTYCLTSTFLSMTATSGGGITNWYSDPEMTNLIGSGTNQLPLTTLGTTSYYVSENLEGCLSPMDTVIVTINDCYEFTATSAFTPDGDGVNDTWVIAELSTRYPNNNVTIFNRWGQVLYNSDGYLIPWDGKYDNKDLPVGSYYYIIDFNDALDTPNATGIVTIIRN